MGKESNSTNISLSSLFLEQETKMGGNGKRGAVKTRRKKIIILYKLLQRCIGSDLHSATNLMAFPSTGADFTIEQGHTAQDYTTKSLL